MEGIPVQALIGNNELIKQLREDINPWLGISLKIWSEIVTKNSLTAHTRVLDGLPMIQSLFQIKRTRFKMWEN